MTDIPEVIDTIRRDGMDIKIAARLLVDDYKKLVELANTWKDSSDAFEDANKQLRYKFRLVKEDAANVRANRKATVTEYRQRIESLQQALDKQEHDYEKQWKELEQLKAQVQRLQQRVRVADGKGEKRAPASVQRRKMMMSKPVKLPLWLETMARTAVDDKRWPNGKYPEAAYSAVEVVIGKGNFPCDGQIALIQLLVNDVERLRELLSRCRDELAWHEDSNDLHQAIAEEAND